MGEVTRPGSSPRLEFAIAALGIRLVDWQAEYGTLTKRFKRQVNNGKI